MSVFPAVLIPSLLVLSSLATYLAGAGAAAWWASFQGSEPPAAMAYAVAAALHLAWIGSLAARRAPWLASAALLTSVWLCRLGFAGLGGRPRWWPALVVEGLTAAAALAMRPPETLGQRLARWRRARDEIATQLRLGDGLVPWTRDNLRRLVAGRADLPASPAFRRLAGELADAEDRLGVMLAALAAPEQVRQMVQTGAARLLSHAQQARAALAVELERQALALAAACREECEALPGLSAEERARAARQCEQLLLDSLSQP